MERQKLLDLSDEALMVTAGKGDMMAFEEIVNRYKNYLINFFFYSSNNYAQAEDLSQEVFIRLFKSAPRYQPQAKFRTFLYTIARNELRRERFRRKSYPWIQSLSIVQNKDGNQSQLIDKIRDNSPNPEDMLRKKELGEKIEQAIADLPEKLKIVFILSEYQGLKYKEIAKIIKRPMGTVKSRMSKAVEILRGDLAHLKTDTRRL